MCSRFGDILNKLKDALKSWKTWIAVAIFAAILLAPYLVAIQAVWMPAPILAALGGISSFAGPGLTGFVVRGLLGFAITSLIDKDTAEDIAEGIKDVVKDTAALAGSIAEAGLSGFLSGTSWLLWAALAIGGYFLFFGDDDDDDDRERIEIAPADYEEAY